MSVFFDDLAISAPGNLEPRRVPIAAPQVSWEINGVGSFSGFVRLDDLLAVGLVGDLKGYWIEYATSAGPWGGVITAQPTTGAIMEIVAGGFATLVRDHVIVNPIVAMSGSAGGLARRALSLAGAGNPTFLTIGSVDEGGGPLAMELVGDVGADILPQIAEAGDVEWMVDTERVFTLARRLGTDRSATVRLVEDRHIVLPRVYDDLKSTTPGQVFRVQGELSQEIMAFARPQPARPAVQPPNNPGAPMLASAAPKSPVWEPRSALSFSATESWSGLPEGIPVGAGASVIGRGSGMALSWQRRRQSYDVESSGVASIPDTNAPPPPWSGVPVGIGANNPAVPARRHVPPPTAPTELTLANIDGCFLAFDLGDTVRVELGSRGTTGRFRVMSKALDVAPQTLIVAGELLRDP